MLSQLQRVPKGVGQVPQPCIVRSVAHTRGKLSTFGGRSYCPVKYHNKFHCKKDLDVQEALKALKERNSNIL